MRTPAVPSVAVASLIALAACARGREAAAQPAPAGQARVLATVNGVPITADDLEQRSKRAVTGGGPSHEASGPVLQTIVREELIAQKAAQLGLDADQEYRRRLEALEAQVRAFRRQELAALYRNYVQAQAAVTDAEAQAYFDQHAALIQTRFHVLQILSKGASAELLQDHQDLKSGVPFEQVAARRFPGLPAGIRPPWDLGELHWSQLPPAWVGVVDRLEPGRFSDVIKGENERYWIVQLAGKTLDPGITFAAEKERIVEILRRQKASALYDGLLAELTGKANVVYPK